MADGQKVKSGELKAGTPRMTVSALRWWTRSQRIRTAAEVPFEAAPLGTTDSPLYQRISEEVKHRIAAHLGVTDKTTAKTLAWTGNADALL